MFFIGTLLAAIQPVHSAELLSRADWPMVRNSTAIVRIPSLQRLMRDFQGMKQGVITIRYPGGDRGNNWALELRDWFVALGVSSNRVVLEPGSGIPNTLVLHASERRR